MLQPIISYISQKEIYLVEPYKVSFLFNGEMICIEIPQYYIFDVSIHRWLWSLSNLYPGGLMSGPSAVHDWMYQNRRSEIQVLIQDEFGMFQQQNKIFTRTQTDMIFYQLMKLSGVREDDRKKAYNFVKWFGGFYWRREKRPIKYYKYK